MSRPPQQNKKRARSPNNNLATFPVNDAKNASVFYGISMSYRTFMVFLIRNDDVFARAVLQRLHDDEDGSFSKYNIQDVIDDCLENWDLENFKRTKKSKSKDAQCADDLEDMAFDLLNVVVVGYSPDRNERLPEPSIPVTVFPNLDVEIVRGEEDYTVQIGKRAFVYRDGKACQLPDVMAQVGTQLDAVARKLSLVGPRFL